MKADQPLEGLRVFVVEDEFAVLLMVEDMLGELSCTVAGVASRIPEALKLANGLTVDVAVLDVNIHGEPVYPVAEVLAARGVAIVFSTGYGRSGLEGRWLDHPVLQKPYSAQDLGNAIVSALVGGGAAGGERAG